ncbi:MAG TPA: PIN domain-containing protein [Nitrososphaerales archaeon]|nr:PIN domain-containing protein [Nitrososphaerales archaeon]
MGEALYDTRFFFEHYYSKDPAVLKWTRSELGSTQPRYASVVTAHELYKLSLENEGREVAQLRTGLMSKEFEMIGMDIELAKESAEIRSRYRVPMADSIIAATTRLNKLECVTDDPHIRQMKEIKVRWLR